MDDSAPSPSDTKKMREGSSNNTSTNGDRSDTAMNQGGNPSSENPPKMPSGGTSGDNEGDISMNSGSSDAPAQEEDEETKRAREERAMELKNKGNEAYKSGRYREAISVYEQALQEDDRILTCYTNMAAAKMMLGDYGGAAQNCEQAIKVDSQAIRPYMRGGRAYLALGDFDKAKSMFTQAMVRDPRDSKASEERNIVDLTRRRLEKVEELVAQKNYSRAIPLAEAAARDAPGCLGLQLKRVEAKIGEKQYDDAYALTTDLLPKFSSDRQLLLLRARALQYQGNVQMAARHLQEALRYDPDNQEIAKALKACRKLDNLKQSGNDAFKNGRANEAIEKYTEALGLDRENDAYNTALYANRAAAYMKLRKYKEAADDCTECLNRDENYFKARLRRAKCLYYLGEEENLELAVRDLEAAKRSANDRETLSEIEQDLRKYRSALKQAKRKDYYKLLNVSRDAGEEEVKKAYKKAALKWHPDRHASKSEDEKKKAEKMFKDIGEAYNVLSDPEKRRKYDMGADLEEIEQGGPSGGGEADMDAMNMFNMFFGGMGGGMGGMGGMPGGRTRVHVRTGF
eukprot:gb/GECG01013800.1/.p1 GENE.gb/GECG01013800.1/~~gb/GECG01013800.1/.p1  ORF type:complete len:571 (+),score=117.18 gb/GECG01013800.1/:1-1713(+)